MEMRSVGKQGVKTTVVCPFFIKTGMFDGVSSRYPLLVPLLEPEWAAKKIISAMRCNQEEVLIPLILNLVTFVRSILPMEVCADILDLLGILDTMEDFKGRSVK